VNSDVASLDLRRALRIIEWLRTKWGSHRALRLRLSNRNSYAERNGRKH
jgi:hypothetical protein